MIIVNLEIKGNQITEECILELDLDRIINKYLSCPNTICLPSLLSSSRL